MEGTLAVTIILICVLAAGAVSKRLKGTIFTLPMVYVLLGLLLSDLGFGIISIHTGEEFIRLLAEATLILVLASDASRIRFGSVIKHHSLPVRLLSIGLPLTMIFGTLLAALIFDGITLGEAAIIGILLSPTDASLGQAVISNPLVPMRIRQTLNIESGLNDGIAMPFLLMAISVATAEEFGGLGAFLRLGFLQIVMGILAGAVVGFLGSKYISWGRRSGWMSIHFQKISAIALALLSYTVALLLGGNGFIAAFVMGITFGHFIVSESTHELSEHVEVEVDLLILLTFMIVFGAVMLPTAIRLLDWKIVLYAVLSLTLVRMIPVAIGLFGTGVKKETVGFLGWFGPRGTASILYLFTVLEEDAMPGMATVYAVTVITVFLSVFAHGMTAGPGARLYGRMMSHERIGADAVEVQEVPKMPERGPKPAM